MKIINIIPFLAVFLFINIEAQSQEIISSIDGADEWERLFLKSYKINGEFRYYAYSSELDEVPLFEGGPGKYTMLNLFDNDPATAWVEGVKGYGEGEILFVGLGDKLPEKLVISNGYQKSESIYNSNSRPKTIELTFYTGYFLEGEVTELASIYRIRKITMPFNYVLKDQMGKQEIPLGFYPVATMKEKEKSLELFKEVFSKNIEDLKKYCQGCSDKPEFQYLLKIEIVDVYKGSRWDDTCISDFEAVYARKKVHGIPEEDSILDVYESDDEAGIIYIDTDRQKKLILVDKDKMKENELTGDDTNYDIVLMDVSPDKEWAQVDILFYEEGAPRAEEYSTLFHVRSMQRIDYSILDIKYGMAGFFEEDGKVFLDTVDGPVDLEIIRRKLSSEHY
jgi:hypothetical protein